VTTPTRQALGRRVRRRVPLTVFAVLAVGVAGVLASVALGTFVGDGDGRREIDVAAVVPIPVVDDGDSSEALNRSSIDATTATVAGPTAVVWGVPAGYGPSPAGAQSAAVGWVASLGSLMRMGPVALTDTLNELMTVRAASATAATFRMERDRFVAEFEADPSRAIWIDSPLLFELVEYSPKRAVVSVWSQLVLGVDSDAVRVLWRTQTVTVVWERDGWRVDDVTRVEGPTPLVVDTVLPSSPADAFSDVIGWLPAVTAGIPPASVGLGS
jgi:hypothetical protein